MLRTAALAGMFAALIIAAPARADDDAATAPAPKAAERPAPVTRTAPVQDEYAHQEVVWEWDPYYTDVDFNVPLTNKPIPTIKSDSETVIYRDLITGSLVPRYMLLEASVYPLPVLGTYLNTHSPGIWNAGQIGNGGINVFESATAGFQEPWAVSAFFGNIANLVRPDEPSTGTNLGYTGYLISAGTKHIKDDVLVSDDWYELEWKLKGKLDYPGEKLSWSFRVGGKFNANPEVTDVMYIGIRRSNLDFNYSFLSWLRNADLDLQVQFSQDGGRVIREELEFGKKYPFPEWGFSLTLDMGFVWDSPYEYSGSLRAVNKSQTTLVFRPSIEF